MPPTLRPTAEVRVANGVRPKQLAVVRFVQKAVASPVRVAVVVAVEIVDGIVRKATGTSRVDRSKLRRYEKSWMRMRGRLRMRRLAESLEVLYTKVGKRIRKAKRLCRGAAAGVAVVVAVEAVGLVKRRLLPRTPMW